MKKIVTAVFVFLFVFACQKGIHWEFDSEGELLKDSTGNCMPVVVAGTFVTDKQTNDSNFISVDVNVTAGGNYAITTDSVNGYLFKASGVFNNVGIATVKLGCVGTPRVAGTDHFNIHYNNSFCEATVTVLSDTIPAADYTLQGSPDTCMNDTIKGNYLQTAVLDTSDKVIISVNVITPGKYSISTSKVNGYSFSADGIFTTTGVQSVTLIASGSPVNTGNDIFTVNANNTICNFSIHVSSAVQVTNPLHFPLTAGSYWTYVAPTFSDTIKRYVNGDTLINDTSFIKVSELREFNPQPAFYRFNGAEYNEFCRVDKYTGSFQYSPFAYGLLPFLKENLTTGTSWRSPQYKGVASFGQVLFIQYYYYCISSNYSMIVNDFGFKDVYVIEVRPYIQSEGNSPGPTFEIYRYYYAKGVGLIYQEESLNNYPFHPVLKILDWKVN